MKITIIATGFDKKPAAPAPAPTPKYEPKYESKPAPKADPAPAATPQNGKIDNEDFMNMMAKMFGDK
jgi:hypothetical protein